MGGGNRNKFERYNTDSEHESSFEDEKRDLSMETDQEISDEIVETVTTPKAKENLQDRRLNQNNSNTKGGNQSGRSNSANSKFLVTRSKRRYDKPQLPMSLVKKQILSENDLQENRSIEKDDKSKPKRETIQSLDSKIERATSFLEELNEKLAKRDEEIANLKKVISASRSRADTEEFEDKLVNKGSSQISELSPEDDDRGTLDQFLQPLNDDLSEDCLSPELIDEKKGKRERSRSVDRSRKRRKRSKSRSRSKSRQRSDQFEIEHCNSKPEDLTVTYKDNPAIKELVNKLVAEQVQAMKDGGQKGTPKTKLKSPSESTLYTPAVPRISSANLDGSPNPNPRVSPLIQDPFDVNKINDNLTQIRLFPGDGRGNV